MASGCLRLTTAVLLTATCLLVIGVDSADKITTCDYGHWQVHRLYCDHGVINVQQALYGRSSSLVCANDKPQKHLANTHCAQPNTANRLKKSCNGKKLCEVSLEDFRKPDPCADTFKYFQTNFTCLPAITVVVCEGSVAHLHCGFGHVIDVYGADYGRRDRTTCSYRRAAHELENVDCTHPTDLVAKMCNGKYACAITASNTVFGDPCVTIYKYLEISYTCQFVDSADKITTCDYGHWQVHRLYCDHGVINVQQALYGRSSSLVCANDKPQKRLANTHCAQPNTANRLKKSCNGKKLCEVSLEAFRKPDPCADTFKYFQTNFTCLPAITVVACEGSVAHLHCGFGHVIYVYGADYGRRDWTTCSYRRAAHELENVDCTHPTDLVAKMCNGKYACAITASNTVFGDPCVTIYKYLEISYTCQCKYLILRLIPISQSAAICAVS
ncbi:L-rhamnose-binding lectin CSL1-like [Syngnathus typhle]|uniref:L-rhamnose-binding lectin CSL1-like n=1 Tax=Syngnathus typhle TaxID=161592 RepID=UPI002A6AFCC2|nr:L-rhamnose-binding lectin CSL1-like [Syngnathus typhle]